MNHPAPFSTSVLVEIQAVLDSYLPPNARVLDPFGGIGGIHDLKHYNTVAVEIEPEWAHMSELKGRTLVGDSRYLFVPMTVDAVVTSPTYANRMADHHNAKDGSYRRTYKHLLGRDLTRGNSGGMQWGEDYRQLHREVYAYITPLVREGGLFVLNVKDHVRKGQPIPVSDFHVSTLTDLGWKLKEWHAVRTPGFRFGENRVRLPERLYTFTK